MSETQSPEEINAFQYNAQLAISLLSSRRGVRDSNYVIKSLEGLKPTPPGVWKPSSEKRPELDEETRAKISAWVARGMDAPLVRYETRRALRKLLEAPHLLKTAQTNFQTFEEFLAAAVRETGVAPDEDLSHILPQPVAITRVSRGDNQRAELMASAKFAWVIEITLLGDQCSLPRLGHTLWSFGEALETIPGVVTEVASLGVGSFWARIRAGIQSIWQRDDVMKCSARGAKLRSPITWSNPSSKKTSSKKRLQ